MFGVRDLEIYILPFLLSAVCQGCELYSGCNLIATLSALRDLNLTSKVEASRPTARIQHPFVARASHTCEQRILDAVEAGAEEAVTMESGAARRGMRVLCPIHTPDPVPPPDEAVPSEAGLSEETAAPTQRHRGCQGNEVFDTAIARDLAGCAYAAYHCVRGDPTVRCPPTCHGATLEQVHCGKEQADLSDDQIGLYMP